MDIDSERLRKSRVMVVGCGALGNEVLKNLVLLGVGSFVLVDFDCVEASNLTRSVLFRRSDVGRRKVDVAKERMLELNPDIEIDTVFGDIAYDVGLGLIAEMDVVVGCVDSRWARYCIQRLCLRTGRTWVDGGILELDGTARVFVPGRSCYACSMGENGKEELRRRFPCSGLIHRKETGGHAPTTPIAASVIGAVQAQEAVKVINGQGLEDAGKMFCYDGESFAARTVLFEAWDEDCELHSDEYVPDRDCSLRITAATKVRELAGIGTLLLNDPFVDYIENGRNGKRSDVMLPARKVAEFVENDGELRFHPFGVFRAHEWDEVDTSFPYGEIKLEDLGIPERDILKFRTKDGYRCIEMA